MSANERAGGRAVNIDDQIGQLVRDAIEPMLRDLEQRLVERLEQPPAATEVQPKILTAKGLAEYLHVSPRTIHRMAARSELPPPILITPSRPRWRRSDIDAWLDAGGAA